MEATLPIPLMLTFVAFCTFHDNVADWPDAICVGFAMKNRILTALLFVVVTWTRAEPLPPRLSVTVSWKMYAWFAAAAKLVIALVAFESATAGPACWIH